MLLAAAATFAATAWHIALNAAPPSWDDAWYLEESFRLWNALTAGPAAFVREYLAAFRIKAPLISLAPLPLYALFGPGERVAVWINLPLAAAAAWGWSKAAAAWWREHPRSEELGALAGALAALLPLAYGLSRVFFAETLVSALLALWAWRCAVATPEDRAEGWRLGILLGLGLLAKSTFPVLALGFAWPTRERLRPHAKLAATAGGALAATWYVENLPYVAGFSLSAGFGGVARDYAGAGGLAARLDWAAPLLPVLACLAARAAFSFSGAAPRNLAAASLLGCGLWTLAQQSAFARGHAAFLYNGAPRADSGWDRDALVAAVLGEETGECYRPWTPEGLAGIRRLRQRRDQRNSLHLRDREIATQLFPRQEFHRWADVAAFATLALLPLSLLVPFAVRAVSRDGGKGHKTA